MKKIFFTLTLAVISYGSYAQTNTFPASGYAGIGTTSPGNNLGFLNVDDDTGSSGITWYNSGPLHYGIYRTSGSWAGPNYQQIKINWDTGILLNPGSAYGKSFVEVTGGGLRVTSGNAGIGTATAPEKLTIADSNIPYDSSSGVIKIRFDSGGGAGGLGFEKETYNTGGLRFYTQYGYGSMIEQMRMTANGNLAIGTTDPKGYKLAVNGNAIATSMTVKLYSAWPDYVFKPAYRLPLLATIKTYIDQNQHLPEMPSAQEVIKNGINLGEMNKLLTKKVEELTLYAIDQQQQIDQLKLKLQKSEQQETRIAVLEKALSKLTNK